MKRLFIIVNLFLLAAVSFYGVKIFYQLSMGGLAVDTLPRPPDRTLATEQKERSRPTLDISTIVDRNLFQTDTQATPQPVAAKPVDVEALKPTELNLKLWGTVASPGGKAFAVIEDVKTKNQRLFRENDQLENATVKKILRGKIVLAVNGRDEVLDMEKITTGSRPGSRLPSRQVGSEKEGEEPEESIQVQQGEIESAVKNVNQLMKQVRIRPHFTNGKADGLRLTGIRSGSIFSRMGLRSGDVLVGVDGDPIQSVDDALKFYKSLKSASNVKLKVKRGGREKTIDYQVE